MSDKTIWCLMIHEREDPHSNQFIYSHTGPLLFSSEQRAKDYVCSDVLIPQLEEALFDEPPEITKQWVLMYDGRHIRLRFRRDYDTLKGMARTLLSNYLDWTMSSVVVDAECFQEPEPVEKRLKN